ncbi:MAG: tetratricopeptide repeat protein [Bacteroidales bacterium]|nr:tetratricopeptide repeat protein [Bacteroidales bacterium]
MQVKINKNAYIILFLFAALLYANTIPNEYALDDKMTIYKNDFTLQGFRGIKDILTKDSMAGMFGSESHTVVGGRYRPLSLVTFAIEQDLFGGNPHISHFINILLYALSVVLLYKLLFKLLKPDKKQKWWFTVPFFTAILFAAHPLHTDAVANIKGRDEILCFLFCIAAFLHILNYLHTEKIKELLFVFVFYFFAVMSKELAITFLFVIPATVYFFMNHSIKKYLPFMLVIASGAILYLIIRVNVIDSSLSNEANSLLNNPFAEATLSSKYATIFLSLLLYIKLIIVPHPLTWDYYPYHIPLVEFTDWRVILSIIIYVALGTIAVWGWRKKNIYAWAIWVYLATLSITSNLFFTIGAFMSERFLYVSLLGFCVVLANVSVKVLPKYISKKYILFFLAIIVGAYSIKTIDRNTDWKNNLTLFGNDVKISKNSAKGNSSYASELYSLAEKEKDTVKRNKLFKEAIPHFKKAIEIYPNYAEPLVRLGNIYYMMNGDYKTMFEYYIKVLEFNPAAKDVWGNSVGVLEMNVHDVPFELWVWKEYRRLNPAMFDPWFYAGKLYRTYTEKQDSALILLERALQINPDDAKVLKEMGITYGNKGEFDKAQKFLLQAEQKGLRDAELYRFLGVINGINANDKVALEYFEKALELDPQNRMYQQDIAVAKQRLGLK